MNPDLDAAWLAFRSALLATGDTDLIADVHSQMLRMAAALNADDDHGLARIPSNVIPFPNPNYHPTGDCHAH